MVGLLFFGGTPFWFIHVTLPGAILLNAYLALYFAVFGFGYCFFSRLNVASKLFLYPSLWTALEYLRGHLLTGFGWVSLGQSQYKNLLMIQIADITGMLGVSFLIVMVNFLLKEWVVCGWSFPNALVPTLVSLGRNPDRIVGIGNPDVETGLKPVSTRPPTPPILAFARKHGGGGDNWDNF